MTYRYTDKNVRSAYAALATLAELPDTFRVIIGNSTYSHPYAIVDVTPETGGQRTVAFLGTTAREATQTLHAMRQLVSERFLR